LPSLVVVSPFSEDASIPTVPVDPPTVPTGPDAKSSLEWVDELCDVAHDAMKAVREYSVAVRMRTRDYVIGYKKMASELQILEQNQVSARIHEEYARILQSKGHNPTLMANALEYGRQRLTCIQQFVEDNTPRVEAETATLRANFRADIIGPNGALEKEMTARLKIGADAIFVAKQLVAETKSTTHKAGDKRQRECSCDCSERPVVAAATATATASVSSTPVESAIPDLPDDLALSEMSATEMMGLFDNPLDGLTGPSSPKKHKRASSPSDFLLL
jgi:hypothetical protein